MLAITLSKQEKEVTNKLRKEVRKTSNACGKTKKNTQTLQEKKKFFP